MYKKVKIDTQEIQLDQFLKWANLAGSGGEAKTLIQAGEVNVNGKIEDRRSRKLKPGDKVIISNQVKLEVS